MSRLRIVILAVAASVALASCKREERQFQVNPPDAQAVFKLSTTDFQAGGSTTQPSGYGGFVQNTFDENAYAINQGQLLFTQFNCVGCHAHGGGGMGPALMDDQWIYGSRPEQIFNTIVEGRPNGMPAWRNKIPDEQAWQIVAYVQSMAGQAPIDALPGRDDHLHGPTSENARSAATPVQTGKP